ncbi:MAG: MogA/MoaB family molybdenum cofactor biosynthesis protein [Deltaproteobacteria bacterium]|nr:MogA/MoaB family molybdenum cofactor biosynthesis protein [Deltaproteobacteria bacterium]MBW2512849.1 MogA/MoaB family molybdenum cofactor biosynthesis protein [Deltaproteobacteria bacterium]
MRAAILTLSDKGARGEREDLSGPALCDWLNQKGVVVECISLIPDDFEEIVTTLEKWTDSLVPDLILTTGGTGVSPRDITPEATGKVIDRELPGFAERMRQESLKKTPHAIISRAIAGIRQRTLIINLPGSPKGAIENLEAVWPAIPHAIAKIQGDPSDCSPL